MLTFPEATSQPPTAMEQSFPQTQNPTNRTVDIMQQLKDPKNIIPDKAVLLIYTNTDWSGSILDSSISSASQQGSSDTRLEFECSSGGIYSMAFQMH
jgi:hypothetical protein